MTDAFFLPVGPAFPPVGPAFLPVGPAFHPVGPARFEPTEHVVGPWSPDFMHGGPPSALLAHEIAAQTAGQSVPTDALMTRLTVEFLKPVPIGEVTVDVSLSRPGRRVAMADAELAVDGETVLIARAWLSRLQPTPVPDTETEPPPPPAEFRTFDSAGWNPGYLQAIEWAWVEGAFETPGPATAWTRSRFPLVADRELAPLERVLLVADSGSGLSAVANPRDLIFVNTELTVHLTRAPVGTDVWMRSQSFLDPQGVGLATTVLGDADGRIGVGNQSLFVAATPGP